MDTHTELDDIDRLIIASLAKDARLSNKSLAALVGLSQSGCLERVRQLREDGVLLGAHEEIDRRPLGVGMEALVFVELGRHDRRVVDGFTGYARDLTGVLALTHISGKHDVVVQVAVRDAHHLRDFVLDSFGTRPEVSRVETSLIFEQHRNHVPPDYLE